MNSQTAVTALHVVAGCNDIHVHFEVAGVDRTATVVRLLRSADLVLLKLNALPDGGLPNTPVLQIETQTTALTDELSVLGYPLQLPSMASDSLHLRFSGKKLRDIVPPSVANELSAAGAPSLDLDITSIEGHLLPGDSGAPIFNKRGRVVAVGDGGLANGTVGISWAIPAKYLNELAASPAVAQTPDIGRTQSLFSAENDARNGGETNCSGQVFTKLRTVAFVEALKSADDPAGLSQLIQAFGVDPTAFQFDVHQHLPSGATVVLPVGASLTGDTADCVASLSDGKIQFRFRIDTVSSAEDAQDKSTAFELALAGDGSSAQWQADAAWSYLTPVTRFDGVTVRRRGYKHIIQVKPAPPLYSPFAQDKYLFETFEVRLRDPVLRGKSLLLAAGVANFFDPESQKRFIACHQNSVPLDECAPVLLSFNEWVKSMLAIQLSTFPVG